MNYRVLIEPDEDGAFVAEVPSLPGCITQGKTREEALANAEEAVAAYLESLEAHGERAQKLEAISETIIERRKGVYEELAKGSE